jgi:hypothetical protein
MAKRLAEFGIAHELVAVPSAGHGLSGVEKSDADDVERRAASFLEAQLG